MTREHPYIDAILCGLWEPTTPEERQLLVDEFASLGLRLSRNAGSWRFAGKNWTYDDNVCRQALAAIGEITNPRIITSAERKNVR